MLFNAYDFRIIVIGDYQVKKSPGSLSAQTRWRGIVSISKAYILITSENFVMILK